MSDRERTVAIVGTGFGVRTQLPAFRAVGGWRVVSLTGRDPDRTARVAADAGVPHALTSIEDAVETGDPDLVVISSPPAVHLEQARTVLESGRHCLLEKPMAMNEAEAITLARLAESRPRQLALVDHELRFLPNPQSMRSRIAAGDIGEPLTARVTFTSHGRARPGTTWDWWARRDAGGGIWGAIGSHVVDMLRWWLGDVASVGARLTTSITELPDATGTMRAVDADDGADVRLEFAGGAVGSIGLTTVAHSYRGIRWEVHGRDGSLWIEPDGRLHGASRTETARRELSSAPAVDPDLDGSLWAGGFHRFASCLLDAVSSADAAAVSPAATFVDGRHVQAVLDAAHRSHADDGRQTRVFPATS